MAEGQVEQKQPEPAPPPPTPEPDHDDDLAAGAVSALSPEEREGLGLPQGESEPAADPAPEAEPDPAQQPAPAPQSTEPQQADPGQEPAQGPAAAPAAEPAQEPGQQADPQAQPQEETVSVPLARLNQVLDGRRQDREEIARLQGLVEGLRSGASPQAQQPAQPTPQQRLTALDQQIKALDDKFEVGEDLTTGDYVKQSRALEQQRTNLLLEVQRASLTPQQQTSVQAPPPADDAYLESQTDQLEKDHPYLGELSGEDVDFLGQRALNEAQQKGTPIDTRTAAGLLRWRTEVAKLSDTLGPALTGKTLQPAGQQPNANAPAQTPAQGSQPSATAQARAEKLELQARMPPDTAQIGSAADKTGLTGADLIARAEKDPASLEDIPPDQLSKFLG